MKLFILFGSLCVASFQEPTEWFCKDFWYPEKISIEECESLAETKSQDIKKAFKNNKLHVKLLEFTCIDTGERKVDRTSHVH